MKKTVLFSFAAALLLSSCQVMKTNTTKTMDIYGAGVIHCPVVVDLDVKDAKVTGTATASQNVPVDFVKQDAVSDALTKSSADVLVEPKFQTVTTAGIITATVTGFPATYKNFRSVTKEDIPLLEVGIVQKANVYEQPKVQPKNKATGAIAGTVTGILLIVLVIALI